MAPPLRSVSRAVLNGAGCYVWREREWHHHWSEGFQSVKLTYLGVLIELDSLAAIQKFSNHAGVGSWFTLIKPACNSFVSDERIVWVSLEGLPIRAWTDNTFSKVASKWGDLVVWEDSEGRTLSCKHLCIKTKMNEIINTSFKIILKGKVNYIRARELDAWVPKFLNEEYFSDEESSESEDGCKKENDFVPEAAPNITNDFVLEDAHNITNEESPQSKDPFNIYELLQKRKVNIQLSKDSGPSYPPGFTPNEDESVPDRTKTRDSSWIIYSSRLFRPHLGS
ncbi:hypothetical protein Tco_0200267 [Tanacetum coccineum]